MILGCFLFKLGMIWGEEPVAIMQLSKSNNIFLFCLSVISSWFAELKVASPFNTLIFLAWANFLIPEFKFEIVLSFHSWIFSISIFGLLYDIPAS